MPFILGGTLLNSSTIPFDILCDPKTTVCLILITKNMSRLLQLLLLVSGMIKSKCYFVVLNVVCIE